MTRKVCNSCAKKVNGNKKEGHTMAYPSLKYNLIISFYRHDLYSGS